VASRQVPVGGYVDPGFERVRAVFERNFEERNEPGAACAACHRGEKVVDWGGYRDVARTRPWTEDTLVLVFSSTKGVAATAMARARADGLFEYDDRVADHWATFGRAGNGDVTVRELLGHRAGVATIDGTLTPSDVADREALLERLAARATDWTPGYWKPFDGVRFGSPRAIGAPGAGGSFAFADPEYELGVAYAPNRMGTHLRDDPGGRALRDAVVECVEARRGGSEGHA
jgi:CubicO group peptidase (beta-lactamase class C family)